MQTREEEGKWERERESGTPSKKERNVVVAFNALLTSLDAKLPTSRFTADELRISNRRGRRPCVASCIRCVAVAVLGRLHRARVHSNFICAREKRARVSRGGKRRWELTATPVCNETFSCSVSFSTMWLVPFPGWHDTPRTVLVVFYCERPRYNSPLATVFCHVASHIVSYQ